LFAGGFDGLVEWEFIAFAVIGGINLENLNEILALKPDYIAMVEAIYKPASITQNLANLKEKMDEYI